MISIRHIPLLMQPSMVQAVINDSKTATRRLSGLDAVNDNPDKWEYVRFWDGHAKFWEKHNAIHEIYIKCPYGNPGDVIWIRETYIAYGHWASITNPDTEKKIWSFKDLTLSEGKPYYYLGQDHPFKLQTGRKNIGWYKRPAIFMPKEACRLFLETESIDCEMLQDITEADSFREGITWNVGPVQGGYGARESTKHITPIGAFKDLWITINGEDSWNKNPWVWIVGFKKTNMPTDFITTLK